MPVILWFRNDLRLADNPALAAALASGQPVLPVYVRDTDPDPWAPGAASRWWLHHSLAALDSALRARQAALVLRRGPAVPTMVALATAIGASAVFTGAGVEPSARKLDRTLTEALRPHGIPLHRLRTTLLFEPQTLRTRGGGPYGVYTPFANACLAMPPPPPPTPAPDHIPCPAPPPSDRLADWALLPQRPDWAGGLRATWSPGEAGAHVRLQAFRTGALAGYGTQRDRPDRPSTSMLSPHLHFGELSPTRLWQAVGPGHDGIRPDAFIRQVLWREFCQHLLWHHPEMPDRPLRPEFAAMPWRDDPQALRAWQRGRTGVPIVDAGMRQLWQTGWMHNRVRMIAGSYLVKHLLLPWQDGARWFWDTLVDADLGNNAGGWQWIAGSGADAAPYFRVFNPVLQGRKFDPEGAYVRRFVPELARLEPKWRHAPWEAPPVALIQAGVILGTTYPRPLIEPAAGRARALAAFAALRRD